MKVYYTLQKPLDARGMLHHIIPLVIVVLFGVLGAGYFVFSSAATSTATSPEVRVSSATGGTGDCLTSGTGTGSGNSVATVTPCKGGTGQHWQMTAATINNPSTHGCLAMGGLPAKGNPIVKVVVQTCSGNIDQQWKELNGIGTGLMVNGRSTATRKECLVDPSYNTTGAIATAATECHATPLPIPTDQEWYNATYKPGGTTTAPTPKPTTTPCTDHNVDYESGSTGTCVGAIQEMVNGVHVINDYEVTDYKAKSTFPIPDTDYSYLQIDNSYGQLTYQDVKSAQTFAGLSADGVVGQQTWQWLCFYNNPSNHYITNATVEKLHPTFARQGQLGYDAACE
jgi:hypothetical protein